jgi:hypothetical protein
MRRVAPVGVLIALVLTTATWAQGQPAPTPSRTDLYHVHFTKAAPGQAAALGKALVVPDKTSPMPDHFVVLRHQEGDDWDYVVIQHLGAKATVDPTTPPPADRDLRAWHNDTFAAGPPWAEFTKAMGIGGAAPGGMVYTVGVQRAIPGHRDQLEQALRASSPASGKIETGNVVLQHVEGADWNFLAITRYNSWQDFAAERAAAVGGTDTGWADIRQHSAFHRDTIADRIFPAR